MVLVILLARITNAAEPGLEQKVLINLPAYSLTLMNFVDGKLIDKYVFPIGIGMGYAGRPKTPIGDGFIYEKRKKIIFRYPEDYPHLDLYKDDIIMWTNTFDSKGTPIGYRMPYSKMRGLGMKIMAGSLSYNEFVIHSTTEEFTVGSPATKGCIRLGLENMLKLYDLIAPDVEQGLLKKPIPLEIIYDLIEITRDSIVVHANVYGMDIDYIHELRKEISHSGFSGSFNHEELRKSFSTTNEKFATVHKQILNTLLKDYPHNFVPLSLKKNLHLTLSISDIFRSYSMK